MRLSALAEAIPGAQSFGDDVEITSLAYDSRAAVPGALFIALRGQKTDGHDFIPMAIQHGASALVVDSLHANWSYQNNGAGLPVLAVPDTRAALPVLSAAFYGHPSRELKLIGVTGTNGKTTTTYMIESILRLHGDRVGLIGTLGALVDGQPVPLSRTTPESADLQKLFREMRGAGSSFVVMEVSSQGIEQRRTERAAFAVGVFTNLTQDHLDTHGDMETYFAEKLKLFTTYPDAFPDVSFAGVVNVDDPYGVRIAEMLAKMGRPALRYGIHNPDADLRAVVDSVRPDGTQFHVLGPPPFHAGPPAPSLVEAESEYSSPAPQSGKPIQRNVGFPVNLKLGGLFQVSNALAAIGVGLLYGIPVSEIAAGLESLTGVAGRFELVPNTRGFSVVVDYAHTPDGLENVLKSARALNPNRLVCVFGCGGDRDPVKRPIMGEISARLADFTVVTSDNPRSENPDSIVAQIVVGIPGGVDHENLVVRVDRREAIKYALCEFGQAGDLIVIAGKGHESGQQFAHHTIPFDDRIVAREVLAQCP